METWVFRVYVLLLCAVCALCAGGYVWRRVRSYMSVKVCRYGKIWTDLGHVGLKDLLNPVTCN